MPLTVRDKVREKIKTMLKIGIIERSISPHCNPLRIVQKPNDISICLDARHLNTYIEDDHEAPPIISEIVQDYINVQYYTKLDLTNGYWQVPLDPKSRQYTTFLFNSTMYHFCRVPFGLKVAGSAFIRTLKNALMTGSERLQKSIRTYIDDLLIGSETFNEHVCILNELFTILINFNFTINFKKCNFLDMK